MRSGAGGGRRRHPAQVSAGSGSRSSSSAWAAASRSFSARSRVTSNSRLRTLARSWVTSSSRRPAGPIGWATLAAAILVLLGVSFAVVAPLAAGSPQADTAPATTASPGGHVAASASAPDPGTTDLPSDPATIKSSALESQLVAAINKGRDQAGCDKLKTDPHLRAAARAHSADMARNSFVSRKGSDDSSPQDRMRKAGYKHPKNEDVGSGYGSGQ